MPRIKQSLAEAPTIPSPGLLAELVDELKGNRQAGQPMIYELEFPKTSAVRATVVWDKWSPLSDEDRTATILQAYERAETKEFRDRIALAIGLTMPEAYESGLLPYRIRPLLRSSDPFTPEQCLTAMLQQGASELFDPSEPHLRFATEDEAKACVTRLITTLPGSKPIWSIEREVGRVDDWMDR